MKKYLHADYGFRNIRRMNATGYREKKLNIDEINFVATGDFADEAKNHCAAVCATNLSLFALSQQLGFRPDRVAREMLFQEIHKYEKNGPVFRFAARFKKFLEAGFAKRRGLLFGSRRVRGTEGICEAIDAGEPCVLLLANDLFHWHWVLAVGYRVYQNGEVYLRLADSWQHRAETFYKPGVGSKLLTARAYQVTSAKAPGTAGAEAGEKTDL